MFVVTNGGIAKLTSTGFVICNWNPLVEETKRYELGIVGVSSTNAIALKKYI